MLPFEFIHAIFGSIINNEVTPVQMLVMRKNEAFVTGLAKVSLNPE